MNFFLVALGEPHVSFGGLLGQEKFKRKNLKRRAEEATTRIIATRKDKSKSVEEVGRSVKAEQVQVKEECKRMIQQKTKG